MKTEELSKNDELSILETRAKILAQESKKEIADRKYIDVIQFRLSSELYAIESKYVKEALPLKDFTPLPGIPSFILGVVNVRGKILSIMNLKKFFDLPGNDLGELNKLIIIRNVNMRFAILADEIIGITKIDEEDIQLTIPTLEGYKEKHIKGITKDCVVVLDGEKLLSDKKCIVYEEVN